MQQPNAIRFSPDGASLPAHVSAWIDAQEASVVTLSSADELMSIGLRARPRFVVADTMDLWIETTRDDLDALLRRVDLLIVNDSEAREMTKETSLIKAGRKIREFGPRYVAIKKGEHDALLFGDGDQFFSCGAYPLEDIHDPTGAGDTFAGGFAGYLAAHVQENVTFDVMRKAVIYGSVLASFCVEAFSLERLRKLTQDEIADRYQMFKMMSQFEVLT